MFAVTFAKETQMDIGFNENSDMSFVVITLYKFCFIFNRRTLKMQSVGTVGQFIKTYSEMYFKRNKVYLKKLCLLWSKSFSGRLPKNRFCIRSLL